MNYNAILKGVFYIVVFTGILTASFVIINSITHSNKNSHKLLYNNTTYNIAYNTTYNLTYNTTTYNTTYIPTTNHLINTTFITTHKNTTLITSPTIIRYAILAGGQSNMVPVNTGPILDTNNGPDTPDNITPTHPLSRILSIYTGIPKYTWNWDYSNYILNSNTYNDYTIGDPMRARNPVPCLGPGPTPNVTVGCGGLDSVSLLFHFAKNLLIKLDNNTELWIINGAYSGSSLQMSPFGTWDPDNTNLPNNSINHYYAAVNLFNNAITKHKLTPLAFLWHQGEFDIGLDSYYFNMSANYNYTKQLYNMFTKIRKDVINATDMPILVGTLLPNLYKPPHVGGDIVYNTHTQVAKYINNSITVNMSDVLEAESSIYLQLRLKNGTYQPLHFSANSQREMGQRYLDAFLDKSIYKDIKLKD